jgi:8-oxo-dGTP pyrophosphatase MutT (NUDIX family)
MTMKLISAALLLETPEGYLFCHPTSRKFELGTYDLPKGKIEEGESPDEAMKRELKEETSLDFDNQIFPFATEYKDYGIQNYNKQKNIYLFYAKLPHSIPLTSLICTSTFTDTYGKEVPEHNGFMYSNSFDPLFPNLKKMLENVRWLKD